VEAEGEEGDERRSSSSRAIRLLASFPFSPSSPTAGVGSSVARPASHPWVPINLRAAGGATRLLSPRGMDAGGDKCGDAAAAEGGEGGGDLYAVLGLKKECSDADLKVAYRKLAKVRGSNSVPDSAPSLRSWLLAAAYRC